MNKDMDPFERAFTFFLCCAGVTLLSMCALAVGMVLGVVK